MLKKILIAATGFLLVTALSVHAGEQQEKMKTCNAEASQKQLKGDDHKAFMKACLSKSASSSAASVSSASSAASSLTSQQEKMKSCSADAKQKALKGDDRKKFMSQCLSKKPAA